jgi:hypothetical protein
MADILEKRGTPYAVIDLDWLMWCFPGNDDAPSAHRMMLLNLAPVVSNYLEAGIRFLILALSLRTEAELESLRAELPIPLRIVGLTVPWEEIERRLASDITAGRQDDLRDAASQLSAGEVTGFEAFVVANDRPIRDVATEILNRLGW